VAIDSLIAQRLAYRLPVGTKAIVQATSVVGSLLPYDSRGTCTISVQEGTAKGIKFSIPTRNLRSMNLGEPSP